ncbi:MAG: DUF2007 domain-containing protein [Bacillota bacterium]
MGPPARVVMAPGHAGDWVVVHTAPNLPLAEMIRDFLAAEGVAAEVRPRGLSPYIGVDSVDIVVRADQEEAAREAVSAFLAGAPNELEEDEPG